MPSLPPTPPPVRTPVSEARPLYRKTLLDRFGPEGALILRARVVACLTFVVTFVLASAAAQHRPATAAHPLLTGLAGGFIGAALMYAMMTQLPAAAGAAALAVTAPSGLSTPYEEQYSWEESLAARGDIPAALAAYERIIAERATAVLPRLRATELYAARGNEPGRAAALFREVRAIPGVTTRDALYACSRLVDLYDGQLDEPGRALVELRRIIELYPASPAAVHARLVLPRLKARLHDPAPGDG